ncbi:MAG: LytR C-terminal domain-containing protein, partial [Leptonema sp. (in: Bacteria)]|nr:LytR C-terminal domain-containing protein [Leptonema sp. (in: bacteria)]
MRLALCSIIFLAISCSAFSNDFTASKDPIHIKISLEDPVDKSLLLYGRLVLFPKEKQALFFFINTVAKNSITSEPLKQGFGVFGDPMREIIGKGSDFRIKLSPDSMARIIDLCEGIDFLVEDTQFFDKALFQYPEGVQFFSGKQSVEYSLAAGRAEKGSEYLAEIDQLNRAESILLNFLWQFHRHFADIDNESKIELIHSLLETDLSVERLRSLLSIFGSDSSFDVSVLDASLELATAGFGQKLLIYNVDRSKMLYQNYVSSIDKKVDGFPIQVLNGTDTSRLAARVKDLIHNRGVRVLTTDNYKSQDIAESTIIEHSGDFKKARLLMSLAAVKPQRVFFRRRTLDIQASLIMGKDFN